MNSERQLSGVFSSFALLIPLCGVGLAACSAQDSVPSTEAVADAKQPLGESEAEAVRKTLAPIRSLETPGVVYMTSIEETTAGTGTFAHVVHVYQPDASGEAIRFEVAARTSAGAVDTAHTFQAVTLTSHPGESDETQTPLANANGQSVYAIATSRQGWYRFSFTHEAPTTGRTLMVRAYDATGNSLKIAWSDPPGANTQVRVRLAVEQASNVFFKGGAYRNADAAQFAYADNVRVDGNVLYKRSFDQGRYSFPVGQLTAGTHTLEFSLSASTGTTKYWFGVDAKSFDPNGVKTVWDPVQFLYYGAMHTGDYDAWSDGVAFAQGARAESGVRPPPVRRGTTFSIALEHPSLDGASNATLRIYPVDSGSEVQWTKSLPSQSDYRGGIYVGGTLSARSREHWRITVPSDAPVGRYVLRAFSPAGARIGSEVAFYVVYNPYTFVASGALSKAELETYGYDEDEDGVSLQAPFGADQDNFRDHFTAYYDGYAAVGFSPRAKITGAFRRTNDESSLSMLDLAIGSVDGTTTEFESMRRLYRLVAQRIRYNRPDIQDDSSRSFVGSLTPDEALLYSKPGTELVGQQTGQCFEYGTILSAVARSAGILARPVSSNNWLGGWGNHVFAEAYIPSLPQHGGKRTSNNASANSDTDPWYTFDATDPNGTGASGLPRSFIVYSEAIAPRAQYGRAALILQGPPGGPVDPVTNALTWDPFATGSLPASSVADLTPAYFSGPEFWLTASGVTGFLGYGEKDVYRISKDVTRAKAVRVRTLPSGGEYLVPKLCVAPASNSPVLPDRCANAATWYPLPAGESYVVVVNDADDVPARYLRGDSVKYVLELEY